MWLLKESHWEQDPGPGLHTVAKTYVSQKAAPVNIWASKEKACFSLFVCFVLVF